MAPSPVLTMMPNGVSNGVSYGVSNGAVFNGVVSNGISSNGELLKSFETSENGERTSTSTSSVSECERLYGPYPSAVPLPFSEVHNEGREGTPLVASREGEGGGGVICDVRDVNTPDAWVPRDGRLVRLTGMHPFNCEPPLALLHSSHRFLTPSSLHYVRNHGACPQLTWQSHQLHLSNGCSRTNTSEAAADTVTLSMDALVALPERMHRELPVTLVCSGNRRKEQNMIRQTIGFNWGPSGVGTMIYKGILLRELLLKYATTLLPSVHTNDLWKYHVEFVGVEDLPNKVGPGPFEEKWGKLVKYGTSIPLAKALNPANNVLIAYQANGEPLAPDHGFPVRLVVPGYTGGRMIKWLQHIRILAHETENHYHYHDNRILPPLITAEESSAQGWWYKPEYIINELNINSAIAKPDHNETLALASNLNQHYTMSGYAYTGGGRAITRVELSLDQGVHWHLATLDRKERATPYGMYWCWTWWDYSIPVAHLIGAQEIWCRAWDASNNCQNDKPTWNLMGMGNNQVFRVKIHLDTIAQKHAFRFEHPTQPGQQSGGWMTRIADKPVSAGFGELLKVQEADIDSVTPPPPSDASTKKTTFTLQEVEQQNQEHGVWIIVKDRVYDCMEYLELHPGGVDSIINNAGADATEDFVAIHSSTATKMLEKYYIGDLDTSSTTSTTASTITTTKTVEPLVDAQVNMLALNPKIKTPFRLRNKIVLSRDSFLLDFELPTPEHVLGLPTGKHLFLSAKINGKVVLRRYTPISSNYDKGTVKLVIKAYHPCKRFPNGGKMSQYLEQQLQVGDYIDMRGPIGEFEYIKSGHFTIESVPGFARSFNMIAGGTGITPVMQIAAEILRNHNDPDDASALRLIFGAREENDLLLRSTFDEWAATYPHKFQVHYILSDSWPSHWQYSTGFVDKALFDEYLFPAGEEVINLMCGPPIMIDKGCRPNLEALGHTKASMFSF